MSLSVSAVPPLLPAASYEYRTVRPVHHGHMGEPRTDVLAAEEPLEISLVYGPEEARRRRTLAVTMRTPGDDAALAAGFLLTEGIIQHKAELRAVVPCPDVTKAEERGNVIRAELVPGIVFDEARLERHFYTSSSCGVCGKTSIEAVQAASCPVLPAPAPLLPAALVHELPQRLRAAQAVFDQTGGLHAAALFRPAGELLLTCEDVGRHNAVDKLVGHALLRDWLPLHALVLLVSGRASFELVQKAAVAGLPVLAAVGAPSSLAVQAAEQFGLTLLGFVRDNRFNIYTHPERITG
ncbi:formate dehydrogenase accessory sulfurtransferase FdhD [Hymenobacter busanensis]|uniref:Sulfur carrier protein FdhD n=1 Tax=Hymenobacter busanensis TaxID=2607656 RepID=A0A7L4ZUN2_9BACT|nr:formate dehydrogenase accessory sulfurtransferase FdhD [Hymenobacter busanensis]KAA9339337.1 formate dehydrogenase accessory sulfurtransferase FdhD [Hymenobacter busanensis]QHJ06901.1 formate dehydrogenase accessory sulfurtransferase FdhD [Hymenobacter busanensis]